MIYLFIYFAIGGAVALHVAHKYGDNGDSIAVYFGVAITWPLFLWLALLSWDGSKGGDA